MSINANPAAYAELVAASNFSFLRGASHPEELATTAATLGYKALAICDRNTVAGVVRAHKPAKQLGLHYIPGCRLVLQEGLERLTEKWPPVFRKEARPNKEPKRFSDLPEAGNALEIACLPTNRAAWGRLCRLLTCGNRRAPKGECYLWLDDVIRHAEGQLFILMPPWGPPPPAFAEAASELAGHFPGQVFIGAALIFDGQDTRRLAQLSALAKETGAPMVAVGDSLYHVPVRKPLQDVLTCIREKCIIAEAGYHLQRNAERHLKSPVEMARLYTGYEDAVARTVEIATRCRFSLDELAYEYPDEPYEPFASPQEALAHHTAEGLKRHYPKGTPEKVAAQVDHELALIEKLGYARYFLTVYEIVRFARSRGILCQGRGSAANSAVCYSLGITAVDPAEIDLLFERFISAARNEPPDIDVDFEHERREEVIQHIYEKYGRDRAGIVATVITYRSKSAIREVGKALGLSEEMIGALSGMTTWSKGISEEQLRDAGLDPGDRNLRLSIRLARELRGFPRHLSQHTGGFVITRGLLEEIVPVANAAMAERTMIEWDKDDLDALGLLKIDVLALGMLSCIRKCFDLLNTHYGKSLELATVPEHDQKVYDMICKADTIGVFQIESRAQMSMLPRLRPRTFYDLVIEVAIVRPGPIQGDMVHPYLRRRDGKEPVDFPSDALREVLGKTMGIPLFQEQAMKIAIVAAGFTPDEADQLRRAMATFRHAGTIQTFGDKLIEGMKRNGYAADFAERCFRQIEGFGEYGFPESHAASFALLAYVSSWLKCHYPDVFACGLINSQPMGFYAPAQIVRDFRDHGGEVREIDINHSFWDCTLEDAAFSPLLAEGQKRQSLQALRLGFRLVKGMGVEDAEAIATKRGEGYGSLDDFAIHTGLPVNKLKVLAEADAFRSIGLNRREALWAVSRFAKTGTPAATLEGLPLFAATNSRPLPREIEVALPEMTLGEHVLADYIATRMSLKAHPLALLRNDFHPRGYVPAAALRTMPAGRIVNVAGIVLVRQRPGTASGVIFSTLEDETGVVNVIIWPKMFERYRRIVLGARLLGVRGQLQSEQNVIHVVARELFDMSGHLAKLADADRVHRSVEKDHQVRKTTRPGVFPDVLTSKTLPKGRNFH
jgi:error-prone DNA polymerase